MIVKIAPIGERVVEVNVESGTCVAEALEIAGVLVNGRTISLNNATANETTPIKEENSILALAGKMKSA